MTGILDLRPSGSAEPILLPTVAEPPRRPPLPLAATLVPIAGAGVLWLVTGSAYMLLFAALGPLIAVASLLDAARAARRTRRRSARDAAAARDRAEAEIAARHDAERAALWAVHPDAGGLLERPTDRWRPATARGNALVLGRGVAPSTVRVSGGGEDGAPLRSQAATLDGAPVAVPLTMGVCVVGPRALARAVARALVLQMCLVHPPDRLALVGVPAEEAWAAGLPHAAGGRGLRAAYAVVGQVVPEDVDAVIAVAPHGAPIPPQCGAVLTVTGCGTATLEYGGARHDLVVEGVAAVQAAAAAASLAAASPAAGGPGPVAFGELASELRGDGLVAPLGREQDAVAVLDLVDDGPHAVVTGVTGSGKSELLITWVAALCAQRTPQEVSFLLVDFKGGTAFDPLAALPHVTGVLTDLDGRGARRAIRSLRAELRRREAALADVGARDVARGGTGLSRLVIVVDEFAAVLSEHPELGEVFTDIGARGRALGMHLILGTQRLGGVVRDALLANCPLRISLRVTDAADSRAVIGGDAAARLPGDVAARGLAYVRRAADAAPRLTRVALTDAADIARIAAAHVSDEPPHRPWLPALPSRLALDDIRVASGPGLLTLGRADEPEGQRQPVVQLRRGKDRGMAVIGGARSGKTTVVAALAAQVEHAARLPSDPEGAWDLVADLVARPRDGALVLLDDLDAVAAGMGPEHAAEFLARVERLARSAGAHRMTVVLTAQRATGAVARIAELLPLRALLPLPSRLEHVSAGGEPGTYDPDAPPGRARLDGRVVQFAVVPAPPEPAASAPPLWRPPAPVAALAVRGGPDAAEWAALTGRRVVPVEEASASARLTERGAGPMLITGDPDAWQRQWSLWTRVRAEHGVAVAATCAGEFRALSGVRALPPYAAGDDRVWEIRPDGRVSRCRLGRHPVC